VTDYTLSPLTQPSGPPSRRRRTGLVVTLAAVGVVLVLAGGVTAWLVMRPSAATTGVTTVVAASATLNPTALQACKALQAAGVDGQADPTKMRDVAKIGSDALDTAIKNDSDALFAAAEAATPDDAMTQIQLTGAASNFMTDCYKRGYIKP
jgi:hypothetical protein